MSKEYNISKTDCLCRACNRALSPGEEIIAVLKESSEEDEFLREDFCDSCWGARQPELAAGALGVWRCRIPRPQEKKKVFIDDDLLVNLFQRLSTADSQSGVNLRFVLALVLMRKKLLVYDRMERLDGDQEIWKMHFNGGDEVHDVVNPRLDEAKISEVSGQLGQILEGQL